MLIIQITINLEQVLCHMVISHWLAHFCLSSLSKLGGDLPLHAAVSLASQNGTDIARVLLMKGVDPMLPAAVEDARQENELSGHSDSNSKEHGWTAIHTACDVSKPKVTAAGSCHHVFT